jgi:predicted transcriptional regulator
MKYMKRLSIQLDEQTLQALNRVAAPGKRMRSEFVRQAIRKAVREAQYKAIREGYRKQPDSHLNGDDWSTTRRPPEHSSVTIGP